MTDIGNAPTASMLSQPTDVNILANQSASPQTPSINTAGEPLVCQWQGCQQPHHLNAETLYDHVCENHIGRKSTNNLNLQCFWGSCRTTTVKRDHITSHIRVHVPLKPHKCEFCQKSFKRPQDLKKHVKTHADESVLFNSPQQGGNGSRPPNGYQVPGNGRQDGSYGDGPGSHHMGYPYGNAQAYHGGNGMHASNFGNYPYGVPQTSSYDNGGLTESRKRAHDNLNEFFGEAKRRNIDAGQYQDLGAQFSQFLQMFAPFAAGGWNGGYTPAFGGGGGGGGPGFDNGGGVQYQTQAAPPMSSYNTPFPELRTKNDLMSIDQFLEQLQHTVYDNETAASAYQPVSGMQSGGFQFPNRNSPPRFNPYTAATPSSDTTGTSLTGGDTPALTPSSFSGNQSPRPPHIQMSPTSRSQGGSLYPTLPSINALQNHNNQFASGFPSGLPPSSLGPQSEDYNGGRRWSGGLLQKAQPAREGSEGKSPDSRPGSSKNEPMQASSEDEAGQQHIKLPGVSEITRKSDGSDATDSEDRNEAKEAYERNKWTIETMRNYVRERLNRGEYGMSEGSEDGNRTPRANQDVDMKDVDTSEGQATTPKREGASLYPVLRPVEA